MENFINFSKLEDMFRKIDFSMVGLSVIAFVAIYVSRWIYKWRNPRCNGLLPPGSMGLPFIGETIQLIIPSASIDLPPFIKKRHQRYGMIFKTNIAGRPVIITADPEFNHFLLKQQGKFVEPWSLDTFSEVFDQERMSTLKYKRDLALNHFGVEALKDKLIPMIEDCVHQTLKSWSNRDSIEAKGAGVEMMVNFSAKEIFSGSLENIPGNISELFKNLVQGLMSFPINLPGTAHNKCLKAHKKIREMMKDVLKERLSIPERNHRDMLDHLIQDMNTQSYITQDFIIQLLFGLLFVSSDSMSTTLTLALKFILEHPSVLEQLITEHETIISKREDTNGHVITWSEYKSMTYTLQVINEVLRMGNISPGLFRRATEDIPVDGYTIPKGWVIMICTSAMHMDSSHFDDPLTFNPSRWKAIRPNVTAKCFMPFGSGMKQCAGAEYSRVFLSIFLHILVTKYRWAMVNGGKIVRAPIIRFPQGFHFKITEKSVQTKPSNTLCHEAY